MFSVQRIESFDLPDLQPYRTMRRQMAHREQGIFVAEGDKVVRRLLASRFEVVSILMPDKWLPILAPAMESRRESIRVFVAEKTLLESLTGFSMYQGLLAVGKVPTPPTLEKLLTGSAHPWFLAAVDGLSSAENLGSVVRNCAAFGVHGLIVGETSSSPYLRRAVRSSMGAVFQLPILESTNLFESLTILRGKHVHCIAAHPHVEGRTLSDANFTKDCCVVFGSEGAGLSPAILAGCDEAVAIPMPRTVDSLNVGNAAAVFLYEATRQRRHL